MAAGSAYSIIDAAPVGIFDGLSLLSTSEASLEKAGVTSNALTVAGEARRDVAGGPADAARAAA